MKRSRKRKTWGTCLTFDQVKALRKLGVKASMMFPIACDPQKLIKNLKRRKRRRARR